MIRRFPLALAVLAVLAASGCGPSVPPDLGVNSVALNLVLGKPPALQQAPVVPAPLAIPAPGLTFGGGAFTFGPTFNGFSLLPPAPPAFVCAAADPAKGSIQSTTEVDNAATNGTYPFRADPSSSYSENGGSPAKFPSPFVATVSAAGPLTGPANPSSAPGEYTFDETQSIAGVTYNTVYESANTSSTTQAIQPGNQVVSELGLSKFQIQLPANVSFTFDAPPGHPLDILKTPANSALVGGLSGQNPTGSPPSWQDAASDPTNGSAMSIQGAVTSTVPVQVDACGQNIDTYPVTATLTFTAPPPASGPVGFTGPTNLAWTLHYDVATGMGGLIVHEDGQTSCTSQPGGNECELNGQTFAESFSFSIDSVTPMPSQ